MSAISNVPGESNATVTPDGAVRRASSASRDVDLHPRRWRIALYSHDTMGLGHMRRNLLIAQQLAGSDSQVTILLIAGARDVGSFPLPAGVDCLSLPALYKEIDGEYRSRHLDLSLEELTNLRAKTILAALEGFAPDLLIVDNVPRGAVRELDRTLEHLRTRGTTRCVLGLRDVLDDPHTVEREWRRLMNRDAIRDYYDAVWVYGDPRVYDLVREYAFPAEIAGKVRYTGYLNQSARIGHAQAKDFDPTLELKLPAGRLALCLVGGGQDGARIAETFAETDFPSDTNGVVVTGPYMPEQTRRRLSRRADRHPRFRVVEFVAEPTLLVAHADRVIAMGGYNTICEMLSFEKRALIVPRVRPRNEQLIRAERFRDLGLLDVLHPDTISARAFAAWLSRDVGASPRVRDRVDLDGLARLPALLSEILVGQRPPTHVPLGEIVIPDVLH